VGRTKKASTAFIHHKFDAPQQTGDDRIDSPAASMGKGRECTRLGELQHVKDVSDDGNALFAQQQAEMFDVKEGTQQLKDISLCVLLKHFQLHGRAEKNVTGVFAKCETKGNKAEQHELERFQPTILLTDTTLQSPPPHRFSRHFLLAWSHGCSVWRGS
jgi:hypothetical protein